MKLINYDSYIKSDDWQRNRQPALDRADGKCERCGRIPLWLEVHHKHYATLGHESTEDIEALCNECHVMSGRAMGNEKRRRLSDAAFDGWATKVYGENWGMIHDVDMDTRYDEFVYRKTCNDDGGSY